MSFTRGLFTHIVFTTFVLFLSVCTQAMELVDEGATIDTGYHLQGNLIEQSYHLYSPIKQLYYPGKITSPYSIKIINTALLRSVLMNLEKYIQDEKNGKLMSCDKDNCTNNFRQVNGLSEYELSAELINSSYCFGTDPFIIASKIRQESKFDTRAVSNTGAIGLTQMTEIGLEEILDQLGHRGEKFAEPEVADFVRNALSCYLGKLKPTVFQNFPKISTYTTKSGRIDYTPETIKNLKKWFSYSKSYTDNEKKLMVKKQIFLGQILLKVYLTYSYALTKNKNMNSIYNSALKMFNGDRIKVRYAKEVIKKSVPRNFM